LAARVIYFVIYLKFKVNESEGLGIFCVLKIFGARAIVFFSNRILIFCKKGLAELIQIGFMIESLDCLSLECYEGFPASGPFRDTAGQGGFIS